MPFQSGLGGRGILRNLKGQGAEGFRKYKTK